MLLGLYRILMYLLAPALAILIRVRALRGHEETAHLHERRGSASLPRPEGTLLWIHAASVGEMRSALPLIQTLLGQNPSLHILITTVTVTAARMVRRLGLPRVVHQYAPFDHPRWVLRFLDHWQPAAVLWLESELWPNALQAVHDRNIPLAMVNGRLSETSARRWGHVPRSIAHVLGLFNLCLAQSQETADRLKRLGARDVTAAGNMKYAGAPLPYDKAAFETLQAQTGQRPCILFASTHSGEEEVAFNVYSALAEKHKGLLAIIMPRHPKRGSEIKSMIEERKANCALRSAGQPITDDVHFYIADTLGEPGLFFRLCPISFLGNSLIGNPGGGHNPVEPAQLGSAIIYGPYMHNFAEIDRDLRKIGGALMARDEKNLIAAFDRLLSDIPARTAQAQAALDFVTRQNTVLQTVCERLRPVLERAKIAL